MMSSSRRRTPEERLHGPLPHRGAPATRPRIRSNGPVIIVLCLLSLAAAVLQSCERPGPVKAIKKSTLTEDERYIVKLYMKIIEIEENLQDNPDMRERKWNEVRREFDAARIERIFHELEKKPERWLAVYGRIGELIERREERGAT